MISSYFPPGKAKNRAFSILGAGQPIGYIIGMILGGHTLFSARIIMPLIISSLQVVSSLSRPFLGEPSTDYRLVWV